MTRRMVVIVVLAAALVVLVAVSGRGPWSSAPAPPPGQAVVVRVVDGDTVVLHLRSGDESVRLIGVDTPETVKPNTPVQCYGPEASAYLHELLPTGTRVRVRRDAEARDRYGRLLLYVWRADDDRFVNLALARGGYARPLSIAPNTAHAADVAVASDGARRAGRGLWGRCGGG
jgi:micrococcal nuclease